MKSAVFAAMMAFAVSSHGASLQTDQFVARGEGIQIDAIQAWPLLHNGRIKPFETLAQEISLFVTGKYRFKGLHPLQFFLATMTSSQVELLEVIEVRSPDLRKKLGLENDRRHFSASELKKSGLPELATPLAEKEKNNKRQLTELERKTLEAMEQTWLLEQVASGGVLMSAMNPRLQSANHATDQSTDAEWVPLMQALLKAADAGSVFEFEKTAGEIQTKLERQTWPADVRNQVAHVGLEIIYNHFKPFRWACWLFLIFAIMLLNEHSRRIPESARRLLLLLPICFLIAGFGLRITITGFAPVTNMYGTMMWVSLGVAIFGWIFFCIYRNQRMLSLLYFGSFLILLLTEQIPLVISPDLDPIVAVLRSNLWLTIHVLTITISYAAFTIAMLLGNATMIRFILGSEMREWIQTFAHYCYRAVQLGVFLLSIGIILGGVWADYSWGRFWGWDPKETWALIADLGFIVLLHARLIGWVSPFRLLMFAPLAYLLVVMAWYGVNFILATGLHSYGFSSGGAQVVSAFLGLQVLLFVAAAVKYWMGAKKAA